MLPVFGKTWRGMRWNEERRAKGESKEKDSGKQGSSGGEMAWGEGRDASDTQGVV